MVLVISRFKVANGLEREVAEAFRKRPHLVESVPGFLGLEVFTSHGDPSLFYLATRWTDRERFHAWHKGPDHHLSHSMLPQGLKLDPTFTQLLELERLPQSEPQAELQDFLFDATLLMENFLTQTESIVYATITANGRFQMYNEAILNLLKISPTELRTKTIWDFLTEPDKPRLIKILENEHADSRARVRLNVIDSSHMPHTLDCVIQLHGSRTFFLIGEEPKSFNQTAVEELMQIQNDMTVTMREESKSGKRLSENNTYLDQLVKERTEELVNHQERLRAMLVELTMVEERERQNLANHLHDYLAQMLVACRLKLAQVEEEVIPAKRIHLIQDMDGILDQSLTFTRTLISDLNPAVLQRQGLLAALQCLTEDLRKLGLHVSRPPVVLQVNVSEEIGVLVFKTVRELLFNVLKHSGLKEAEVQWESPSEQELVIRVIDSGKGFDPVTRQREQAPGHLGLFFYRQRIEAVEGSLNIISCPNEGTTVTVTVPLSA